VDAERSKAALLDAALDEFAAKGFSGARVRDIAERAGVSKDLVAYHFGGKEGLYQAVERAWIAHRDGFVDLTLPLHENLAHYLHEMLRDPRPMRMLIRLGLSWDGEPEAGVSDDVYPDTAVVARRQAEGAVSPEIDSAVLQLMMQGAVAAPILFPDRVDRLFGMAVTDPRFETRYRDGLLAIFRTLGVLSPTEVPGS
jgi:AcrR family transcriptional regulator